MPTITVLAPDSALAMDEVVRQLGDDAFILSTSQQDGMVQIRASNDPATTAPKRAPAVQTIFEGEMEKQLAVAGRGRLSVAIDDLVDDGAPVPKTRQAERPQLVAVEGGMASAKAPVQQINHQPAQRKPSADTFIAAAKSPFGTSPVAKSDDKPLILSGSNFENRLSKIEQALGIVPNAGCLEEKIESYSGLDVIDAGFADAIVNHCISKLSAAGASITKEAIVSELANDIVGPSAAIGADVLIVVGPSGGGKTTLAAKFAAFLSETNDGRNLELISCRDGSTTPTDLLACHAGSLKMRAAAWDAGLPLDGFICAPGSLPIFDMDCTSEQAHVFAAAIKNKFKNAKVHTVMALPSGLAPARIAHELEAYSVLEPEVVLTKLDECECSIPEMSQIVLSKVKVGWLSGTRNLTGNLAQASAPIMEQYLQGCMSTGAQDVPDQTVDDVQ